jgi:hypothetical protein
VAQRVGVPRRRRSRGSSGAASARRGWSPALTEPPEPVLGAREERSRLLGDGDDVLAGRDPVPATVRRGSIVKHCPASIGGAACRRSAPSGEKPAHRRRARPARSGGRLPWGYSSYPAAVTTPARDVVHLRPPVTPAGARRRVRIDFKDRVEARAAPRPGLASLPARSTYHVRWRVGAVPRRGRRSPR